MTSSFKKTAMAVAVAGTLATAGFPAAEADVINLSWSGAFTWLNPAGLPVSNIASDYEHGYYANGDSNTSVAGAPYFPGNVPSGTDCTSYAPACITAHGWYAHRTPVSGTMAFDFSTSSGVGTINPFLWLGDTPGSGPGTHVAHFQNLTFQMDTVGTIIGTMLLSWNGSGHSLSIVLDGSGLIAGLGTLLEGGPTTTVSGVGALPASNNVNFGTAKVPLYLPLGPAPLATKTLNALGCEAQPLATQVDTWTIIPTGNIANCDLTQDDGIGGSPAVSTAFQDFNFNFDFMSVHLEPSVVCTSCPPPVPVPPAIWLFGSGLLGLIGLARRKKKINQEGTASKI